MIPLSGRYALPTALALGLFAIPIWIHQVAKPRTDDCLHPDALLARDFLPGVRDHKVALGESTKFFASAWGTMRLPGRWFGPQHWRISRSYRLGRYYFKPQGMFTRVFPDDLVETRRLEVDGVSLPIQLRTDRSEGAAVMTAHLYVFAGQPIVSPFRASIANALDQLREGTYPMTMILLSADAPFAVEEENRTILVEQIGRAWRHYREVCEGR